MIATFRGDDTLTVAGWVPPDGANGPLCDLSRGLDARPAVGRPPWIVNRDARVPARDTLTFDNTSRIVE